ncbi:ASCH domain-containing protein [Corynebacterium sp. TAE3-ERU16]|uniref:ASCH domain-containing protein n=1 Tax=Corynebacterium sp. TAE3-ERU16 TaxID=2849493 RepID=UPI001C444709|nr:ASCH domain-containing protein [Corynebacterium sp. TAE3-ERU16]
MRDALVAAILGGEKTATSTQLREHEAEGTDPRAPAATREVVVDSDNRPVCVIETTDVVIRPFGDADDEFAPDRGRGVHDRPGVGVGAPRVPAQHRIPRSDRRSPLHRQRGHTGGVRPFPRGAAVGDSPRDTPDGVPPSPGCRPVSRPRTGPRPNPPWFHGVGRFSLHPVTPGNRRHTPTADFRGRDRRDHRSAGSPFVRTAAGPDRVQRIHLR